MHILMVSGSWTSEACGVGDNAAILAETLSETGIKVYKIRCNNLANVLAALQLIKDKSIDIVHIHYPTQGYGKKLFPQMLSFLLYIKGIIQVVSIHEFQRVNFLRKLAIIPFGFFANRLIFTNSIDLNCLSRACKFAKSKSNIIPIPSNVSFQSQGTQERINNGVVYFGLIAPKKGIEHFIQAAADPKLAKYRFTIIGAVPTKYKTYYQNLKLNSPGSVIWEIDQSLDTVAKILQHNTYAYLPFPHGASERNSTLFAAFEADLIVLTTKGLATTEEIESATFIVVEQEFSSTLLNLEQNKTIYGTKRNFARKLTQSRSWDSIKKEFDALYTSLVINKENRI